MQNHYSKRELGGNVKNNWVDSLIIQYEEGRKDLQRKNSQLGEDLEDKIDKSLISSMISSMSYSINWMKIGRRPDHGRKGIDRRHAYHRRSIVDVETLPSLDIQPKQKELTENQKQALFNILMHLSHRERQCYLLHYAEGWSMQDIADELGVTKSSVQKFIERAREKIERNKSCHTNVI